MQANHFLSLLDNAANQTDRSAYVLPYVAKEKSEMLGEYCPSLVLSGPSCFARLVVHAAALGQRRGENLDELADAFAATRSVPSGNDTLYYWPAFAMNSGD